MSTPNIDIALEPLADVERLGQDWRTLQDRADIDFYISWGWIGTLLA